MNDLAATRGEATRARILATAREALAQSGLERFVMRAVAEGAGVKLGNLQYYFPTREDLLEAVIREEGALNIAAVRALEDEARDLDDYVARLAALLLGEYTAVSGNVWAALSVLRLHKRRFRELSRAIYREHYAALATALARFGVAGGSAAVGEKARLITALLDGAALQAHAVPHAADNPEWRSFCEHAAANALTIARD